MKKNIPKPIIIVGAISILGVALFIGGFIFLDTTSRTNRLNTDSKKENVSLKKDVPTEKDLHELRTPSKKKQMIAITDTKDITAPTITAPEETVEQHAQINIYENVTAIDANDGDITTNVFADKALDTSVLGTQIIRFSATDTNGNTGVAERIFHIVPKSQPAAAPQVEQAEQTPAIVEPTQTASASAPEAPAESAYGAMTITMNGQTIPYQNGGQASGQRVIDSNPTGVASTWGGAAVQSGNDGQNTHFIGHNPGAFATTLSLGPGSQIIVTDTNGTPTTYTVRTLLQLDDYGTEINTGTNYWDLATGTGGGERITLQSCENSKVNLLVFAYK